MFRELSYKWNNGARAIRRWVIPYIYSRVYSHEFRPILCYLYTEWRCNIDCHYCHQYDNKKKGMDLETAKESLDWLKSLGCRVVPIMGGEPLLRKDFTLEVIRYGAANDFFMYLPTNGYLMDEPFVDELGRAGVAAVNLAVDCVAPRKGLPKALLAIEPQFRYLVEQQKKWGYLVFFNINICRTNIRDVRLLTEIAHQNRIGTDYHLNEPPHSFTDQEHYTHKDDGLFVRPEQYDEVDRLLDWLIEKQREGWAMVNSIDHLQSFKRRMRGDIGQWECRAGMNGGLIRPDGTLAPCFDMINHGHDWGCVGAPRFDHGDLSSLKESCMSLCSSTCFHTMAHYYNLNTLSEWVRKHMRVG